VLDALVYGNLAELARDDRYDFYNDDSPLFTRGQKEAPVVYTVLKVDKTTGKHVPQVHLLALAKVLRNYTKIATNSDDAFIDEAVEIDNAFHTPAQPATQRKHIKAGRHKFLWQASKTGSGGKRKVKRIAVLQRFCKKPGPATVPLHYVGYALCFNQRTPAHAKGAGSSFLLQLVRHSLQMLYPNKYGVEAYPVFYACDAQEARIGEQLITLVGHGLADSGRGLGIHPAGINNSSADLANRTLEEGKKMWDDCEAFRAELGWFDAGLEREEMSLLRIDEEEDETAKRQQEQLAALKQRYKDLVGQTKERHGTGPKKRILQRFKDADDELIKLAEIGGDAGKPLVAKFKEGLDTDRAAFLRTWPQWHAAVREGLD
jgi:hypothetical protein